MRAQRGFALVTAVFLLVVLAGLGTAMGAFFVAQQQSSALDVVGTRAYHAARAGVEWGVYQVIQANLVGGTYAAACQAAPVTESVPLAGTLSLFSVAVTCSASRFDEGERTVAGGNPLWLYRITATAVTPGAAGDSAYVERQVTAIIQQ